MGTWNRVVAWLLYGALGVAPPAPAPAPAAPSSVAALGEGWRTLPSQDRPVPPKAPARRPSKRRRPDADRIIADTQGRVSVMDDVDSDVQAQRDAQIRALGPDQRGGRYYAPPTDDAELALLPQNLDQPHYAGGRSRSGLAVGGGGGGASGGGGRGTSFGSGGTTAPHGPPIAKAYARAGDYGIPTSMTAALRQEPQGDEGGVLPAPPQDGAEFQAVSTHGDGLFSEPPKQNSDGSWDPRTPQNW